MPILTRRNFLKAAGTTLCLPIFESLGGVRSAQAQSTLPKRMVIFLFPTGIFEYSFEEENQQNKRFWYPSENQLGRNWTLPQAYEADTGLNRDYLQGLADLRDDFTIVKGLGMNHLKANGIGDPHQWTQCALTGVPMLTGPNRAGGPSVDQVAGQRLGGSLVIKLYRESGVDSVWSWKGSAGSATANEEAIDDPRALYRRLFPQSGGMGSAPVPDQYRKQRSMLDFVKSDAARLRGRLGRTDQLRLDEHLQSVRELETRFATPAMPPVSSSCDTPTDPGEFDVFDNGSAHRRLEALIDLAVLALRCDLTRVVVFTLGSSQHEKTFPFLKAQTGSSAETPLPGNHSISHYFDRSIPVDGTSPAVSELGKEMCRVKNRWAVSRFGSLLRKMKSVVEGEGTLLDNSAVACVSDISSCAPHYYWNVPVLVAGGLGGRAQGRFVTYGCNVRSSPDAYSTDCPVPANDYNNASMTRLWLTMLRAVGAASNTDGFGEARSGDTLADLW